MMVSCLLEVGVWLSALDTAGKGSWKNEESGIAQPIGQTQSEEKTRSKTAGGFAKEGESGRTYMSEDIWERIWNYSLISLYPQAPKNNKERECLARGSHSKFSVIPRGALVFSLEWFPSFSTPGVFLLILSESPAFWSFHEPRYSPVCLAAPSFVLHVSSIDAMYTSVSPQMNCEGPGGRDGALFIFIHLLSSAQYLGLVFHMELLQYEQL